MPAEFQEMLSAQAAHESSILSKPNVVGVAVGLKESHGEFTGEMAIIALVDAKRPLSMLAADEVVPNEVDGVRTDVYEVGQLRALAQQPAASPRERFRPEVPGGVSAGHFMITAGTHGTVVYDRQTGQKLLLSNNHVFANSNDAAVGDPILQPGPLDGGSNPADRVAVLERFVPLRYVGEAEPDPTPEPDPGPGDNGETSGCLTALVGLANLVASLTGDQRRVTTTSADAMSASAQTVPSMPVPSPVRDTRAFAQAADNAVDAAVARPVDANMFVPGILGIGTVGGTIAPQLGMAVRKQGRTTGLTTGSVTLLNATINVAYNTKKGEQTARFTGQVITTAMSQGGDSGSLILDAASNNAVGLLFAGSSVASIFTPIDVVMAALDIRF